MSRPRFGLRLMLLVSLLFGVLFGWLVAIYRVHNAAQESQRLQLEDELAELERLSNSPHGLNTVIIDEDIAAVRKKLNLLDR